MRSIELLSRKRFGTKIWYLCAIWDNGTRKACYWEYAKNIDIFIRRAYLRRAYLTTIYKDV